MNFMFTWRDVITRKYRKAITDSIFHINNRIAYYQSFNSNFLIKKSLLRTKLSLVLVNLGMWLNFMGNKKNLWHLRPNTVQR